MWRLLFAQVQEVVQEADPAAEQPASIPLSSMLPMIIAFFAIMYFLIIRPQQKRERERQSMLSSISKGDNVVTTGGICGSVVGLSEERIVLHVDENVTMEFVRGAIAQVLPKESKNK